MTYVVSNLHGQYEKFKALLEEISFGDKDVMYVLGDIVDYGERSMELIADLSVRYNVYSIVGEHDYTAARMLSGFDRMLSEGADPDPDFVSEMTEWANHGGKVTLDGFRALDDDMKEGVLDYLSDLSLYEEVTAGGQEYVLVHAGIADFDPDTPLEDYQPEDFIEEPADPERCYFPGKTLVVGHIPTENHRIFRGEYVTAIDCGAAFGGKLGCLCLENGEETYI